MSFNNIDLILINCLCLEPIYFDRYKGVYKSLANTLELATQ